MTGIATPARCIAIIPARGGSKRLPGKNLKPLCGKPLIAWTIEAARGSRSLGEILVSTDSPAIAETAAAAGASAPFLRPPELASDTASTFDVVAHALDYLRRGNGREFEYTLLLQPTSPLRTSADIDAAFRLLEAKRADGVVSVCAMDHSPLWSNVLPPDLSMAGFLRDEVAGARSQDLPVHYRINGAIYLCRTERMLREKTFFFKDNCFAHVMPKERSQDIDDESDFAIAEFLAARGGVPGAAGPRA